MAFRLRLILAILVAKVIMWLVRLLGRGKGSSLPGMVALRICPGILPCLARQARRGVIMVTGTNGKTTTNNMIARVVREAGYRVVVNAEGANLITGVTAAFLKAASLSGRVDCDYALLEVDEASFPRVTRQVYPNIVVITNFFRDQLDRYGELDKTISLIREALVQLSGTRLVLNADDPLVAPLAASTGKEAFYYGLGEHHQVASFSTAAREGRFCPHCGRELVYVYYHYSQLGNYRCPGCGFSRPFADVEGTEVSPGSHRVSVRLRSPAGSCELVIPVPGLYNLYNGLAAFSAGLLLDVEPEVIISALAAYTPATGRMERFRYRDKAVLLNLVKNPTGFNEGLNTLLSLPGPVDVLIAINDNDADGRDISWLWDVDFEVLEEHHFRINFLVCTGQRGAEMAVRLKYAGVPLKKIVVEEMPRAVEHVLSGSGKTAYLLATYTALWPLERILSGYAKRENHVESLPSVS
ncbi:MurT ligase domain-containing protein [Desulfofundulus sp. TPOSR]|uniref:MurT ligase domain-containing protein n=1 Tax=Desulfofundulus sp. TPOSR TaxID=2714340 RepID=UPI001FAC6726|nr:MurT ligase domain-containing protein [Desulfofundulus sp. TPOSR]